jgi:hypothetical protein
MREGGFNIEAGQEIKAVEGAQPSPQQSLASLCDPPHSLALMALVPSMVVGGGSAVGSSVGGNGVVCTSLGPLSRWVPGPTTRWSPGTTRLVPHGT